MTLSQHRRCVKVISASLSAIFFFTQVAFAHLPSQALWDSRREARQTTQLAEAFAPNPVASSALSALLSQKTAPETFRAQVPASLKDVPLDAVTVRDTAAGAATGPLAGRRVLIVQDVHMNGEAQSNVAKLLFSLMSAHRAGLVGVEGAVGPFDFARFRAFPDKAVTRDVATTLFADQRMAAPSFAGLTSAVAPPPFVGVDDAAHYEANVAAYLRGAAAKDAATAALNAEERELNDQKKKTFPTALARLDAAATAWTRGERGLGEHLSLLEASGALAFLTGREADAVHRFLDAWRLERNLDFTRADLERRAALEKLVARLAPGEMENVVALSLAYRDGAVSYGDYYRQISDLFVRHRVSLEKLPAFRDYLRYVALSDGIGAEDLLSAAARATAAALDRAATTPAQRALIRASRRHELKRKLVAFALTPREWNEYQSGSSNSQLSALDSQLKPFEDFYREAHVRSERMSDNFAAAVAPTDKSQLSVLIIGGFHAPEMAERLREMGASTTLVSPRLTKVDVAGGSAYLSVFSREKTPLDRLFAGEKLFVYPADRLIAANGPRTVGPNTFFAFLERATAGLRGGARAVVGRVAGRSVRAIGPQGSVPLGYAVADRETVGPTRIRILVESASRAAMDKVLSFRPWAFLSGFWDRLVSRGWISRENATRIGFLEEVFFAGILIAGVPALLAVMGVPSSTLDSLRPALLLLSAALFSDGHEVVWYWTEDGLRSRPATEQDRIQLFVLGLAFRWAFLIPGVALAPALAGAMAAHAVWTNVVAPLSPTLATAAMSRANGNGVWWKDPSKTHVAMTVPIFAVRRDAAHDPGIGKFSDLPDFYERVLKPQGVDTVLLSPHYATMDESPYAPVSLKAVQERSINWSIVKDVAETDKALLVAPASKQDEVDYAELDRRERPVALRAFARFQATIHADGERRESYANFVKANQPWLTEYADLMALHEILGRPVLEWNRDEINAIRANDPRYEQLRDFHKYAQWIGQQQLKVALRRMKTAGAHVLFDMPMFRGKDSAVMLNHPEYFRDPMTRSAGIRNQSTDQTWGDLALWNWDEMRRLSFEPLTDPVRHWLDFGFDGARMDALHFAYPIGQFGNNDEPGDALVSALAAVFRAHNALPVAEAFENKARDIERQGFLTIADEGSNWKRMSTHDDHQRNYAHDPVRLYQDFGWQMNTTARQPAARFVAFTLGDLTGETSTVKRMNEGRSEWRFRVSAAPVRNLGPAIRLRTKVLPMLARQGRTFWNAAPEIRGMFEGAVDSFVKKEGGQTEIWAASRGRMMNGTHVDWFQEQWGRDTFISLPGLLLSTGRADEAKEVIESFAKYVKNGIVPNRIPDARNDRREYNNSDGSMWFMQAIRAYVEKTGDWAFVDSMMPVMTEIMSSYEHGTGYSNGWQVTGDPNQDVNRIRMDADGLVSVPGQSTWMDADPDRKGAMTPRNGKPVEVNALWYANLRFMEGVTRNEGDGGQSAHYRELADKVRTSFNERFWNASENALLDVVDGDPHGGAIRPNMLFAVSLGLDLLPPQRQALVFASAKKNLFTPYGIRTLDPRDSHYRGRYDTDLPPLVKDRAYHQGTAWPWLLGAYIDAMVRVRQNAGVPMAEIRAEIRESLAPIVEAFIYDGSISEVYDGSPRADGYQRAGGTSSQAWSVAEVMRVLIDNGVLGSVANHAAMDDHSIIDQLKAIANNFQQNFRGRARALFQHLLGKPTSEWTDEERNDSVRLIGTAHKAFDWRTGYVANSKYYESFKGHPTFLMSLEARVSASQVASTREEYEEMMRAQFDRLSSNQGGLGDLEGGVIAGGLADMGMVTTLDPNSEAPEAVVFLPNYRHGVRLSKVDEWGWPISDAEDAAWAASRPQDFGIELIEDPQNPSEPLTVTVPVRGIGDVKVNFRAIEKDGLKIIMIETDQNDTEAKRSIFNRMYQGSLSSEERFRQQWVYGIAAQKFKERFGLPDGPMHLNETATFAMLVGRIRESMEKLVRDGVPYERAYEIAMEQVGQQLVFYTHTLVEAGVDRFFQNIAFGDYVRELFEESPVLKRQEAWNVTKWLVEGKPSSLHESERLPGFWFDKKGEPHYSPLNFVVNLAYMFGGDVVAVSRLNARKAGEFLVEARILTPEQVAARPVNSVTNATDELFFVDRRQVKAMNLQAADPSDRRPENILNPDDPQARKLFEVATGREWPAALKKSALSDAEQKDIKDDNRAKAIQRMRWGVKEQYIRNITALVRASKDRGQSPARLEAIRLRLDELMRRWEVWTGERFPDELETMRKQELKNLYDPNLMLADWSRRIVEYKRMLFTVFGEHLPLVEQLAAHMDPSVDGIDKVIDTLLKENGSVPLDQLLAPFVRMIEVEKLQFAFAGPTFDYRGRAMVAILDRVLQKLAVAHPLVTQRALYIEGYNDELSHYLVQGADVWLNTPKRPLEASGTSGMKADAVNLTVLDGWAADGGFDGLNVIAIKPKSKDLDLDHPDEWPGRKKTEEERQRLSKTAQRLGVIYDVVLFIDALRTDGFNDDAQVMPLARALLDLVKERAAADDEHDVDSFRQDVRTFLAQREYPAAHVEHVVDFSVQEWKAKRYLREEAESLYGGLAAAAGDFYQRPNRWLDLVRRSFFFKMVVYSIRSASVGRYIPTSDERVSAAGHEIGLFDLYERAIKRMKAGASRVASLMKYSRIEAGLRFESRVTLGIIRGDDAIEARLRFDASRDAREDSDIFLLYGVEGTDAWKTVKVPASAISEEPDGAYVVRTTLAPGSMVGTIGVTAFAAPKNSSDPALRVWASRGPNDNARFVRVAEGQRFRNTIAPSSTPGAAGFWAKTGAPLSLAGALEGVGAVLAAASVMGLLAAVPFLFHAHIPALAMWAALTTVGLAVAAKFLVAIHRHTGVTLAPGLPASHDPADVAAAIRTSFLSLLGIPLIAAAFVLSSHPAVFAAAFGFILSIAPHAVANARGEKIAPHLSAGDRADAARVGALIASLRKARRIGDVAAEANALAGLVDLERLDLDSFGEEGVLAVRAPAVVSDNVTAAPAAFAVWRYAARAAKNGTTTVTAGAAASLIGPKDHLAFTPTADNVDAIVAEARGAVAFAGGRPLSVVLPATAGLQDAEIQEIKDKLGGTPVLAEADLADTARVRAELLDPALKDGGKLKLLVRRGADLPDFLVNALVNASRGDARYRGLVELLMVSALTQNAFAVRATLNEIQKAMEYRDLVMSQA